MMKDVKLQSIGEVRTYILQAWHEFKNGFVKEFDLPSFYSNVDLISTFFENEYLTKEIDISKWKNFLTIIRNDAQKINDGTLTGEFVYNYLSHHLDLIEGEIVKFEVIDIKSQKPHKETDVFSLSEEQSEALKKMIPKINTHIAKGSTFEQWEKVFTKQDLENKIILICKNKLLASFLTMFRSKFNIMIADTDFGNKPYFDKIKSPRFIEVASRTKITQADKDKLADILN